MKENVKAIYDRLMKRDYREMRDDTVYDFAEEFAKEGMPLPLRVSERLARFVELEKIKLFPEDKFGFYRSIKEIRRVITDKELEELNKSCKPFEEGTVGNIASDYKGIINTGFDAHLATIEEKLKTEKDEKKIVELKAMKQSIEATYRLCERYKALAIEKGNKELAEGLKNIPMKPATSFYEALLMLRVVVYMLWLNGNKHITIGRFDQYMWPFYDNDIEKGIITREEAYDLVSELFLALNFDADLYPGIQQGDNGQSLVLGGCDIDGNDCYNDLSKLVLEVSLELNVIDPKINLRVNKDTDDFWYELGTELTAKGLGFPQYSNDDIVIPALVSMGYDLKDARDYVMAACWEFIIPGKALDIPNIAALDYAKASAEAIESKLMSCDTFEDLMEETKKVIGKDVKELFEGVDNYWLCPSPFQSLVMTDCVSKGEDIVDCAKYNNFGFHGVGISNGTDALYAIKAFVYGDKSVSKEQLLAAIKADYVGYEALQKKLHAAPKMGFNDDEVDSIACELMDCFSKECAKHHNNRGGIIRPGTGSALWYVWFGKRLGATADGRKAGEYLAANYSPSLSVNLPGILSAVSSFTKPDLKKTCNGGPMTIEFHDTVFRNPEGKGKVAALVKTFIALGGHQLQLNAINRDILLDAQKHPENHKNLIVRVWGWSGYFNELDLVYQNHVIQRAEFTK